MKARDVITLRLAKKIKPIVRFGFLKKPYYVLPRDISCAGYERFGERICKAKKLVKLGTITTKHRRVGYEGAFEPTVDEVLWQIPQNYIEDTVAFETVHMAPFDDEAMYELSRTTLYGLKKGAKMPKDVSDADLTYYCRTYKSKDIAD